MKHLGIIVAGGFMARNILRTGVLKGLLDNADMRATIFVPIQVLESMQHEFKHDRVIFQAYTPLAKRGYKIRMFLKYVLLHPLNWTMSSRRLFRHGYNYDKEKQPWWFFFVDAIAPHLTQSNTVRKAARKLENTLFREKQYDNLIKESGVDALFSTSISTGVDVAFIKAAKRLGIPTISMSKGWDIFLYALLRINADHLLTQNEYVKQNAITYQMYKPEQVTSVGFPQFDMYASDEWKIEKEEVFRRMGLSPNIKTLFFGSCGRWSPHDDRLVDQILDLQAKGKLKEQMQIIIRPHFSDVHKNRYDRFRNVSHIHVDDGYNFGNFGDHFDVSVADAYWLANIMFYSDVICTFASTLILDAIMLDKPVILLGFGGRYNAHGKNISERIYLQEHFDYIIKYNFAQIVRNSDELLREMQLLKQHGESYHKEQREALKQDFLHACDGKATRRISDTIYAWMSKSCEI